MRIYVLMGQRKESYEGEYGPEALAVMTEYDHDENPTYLEEKRTAHIQTDAFESVEIVTLDVDLDSLMAILRPSRVALPAQVKIDHGEGQA